MDEKGLEGRKPKGKRPAMIAGWREWMSLPELGINQIKVKLDTGARTSALHAFDIKVEHEQGKDVVLFKVHPLQRSRSAVVQCQADLVEMRKVRSSSGHCSIRPLIETRLQVGELSWKIQLTLTNRDAMGFRMLLGRQGMPPHLFVNASKSFLLGRDSSQ